MQVNVIIFIIYSLFTHKKSALNLVQGTKKNRSKFSYVTARDVI